MKIEVYQSGGFAGEQVKLKELDTDNMGASEQENIQKLITQAQFFKLNQQEVFNRSIGSDLLLYEITISDKTDSRSLQFVKSDKTTSLNDLMDYLLSLNY